MENPHAPRVFEDGRRINLLEAQGLLRFRGLGLVALNFIFMNMYMYMNFIFMNMYMY